MFSKGTTTKILSICTIFTSIIYIIWRTFFTLPFGFGFLPMTLGILLLVVEIIGMFESAIHFYNMTGIEVPEKPEMIKSLFPDIDVFVATYNEPSDLLYKTINGCLNMDYPDKSLFHIYICDDGNRAEVKALAKKMGVNYITREEREHAKAGNLNNALSKTSSPLIVTFDADMIPMSDFLMTCVPYFYGDEKIGFIQLPQSFYNPDLFQYNLYSENRIPNEQDYFYRDIQVAKNKTNSVIYGGSNTVLARQALEEIGGFYTGTITEDFATGLLIESSGYRCYALDEIHASGLSPSDLKNLVSQRSRWARGCIKTGRKVNILFRRGLTFSQRMSYSASVSYWYFGFKRLAYIMSPILFSVFNIMVVKCDIVQILLFWLPMYLFTQASLKKLSRNIRTLKWTSVYETILFPTLIIPVFLETFGISQKKFVVTKKERSRDEEKLDHLRFAIPHIILAILSFIGIGNSIRLMFTTGSPGYIVVLFWLVSNLYSIFMALFFLLGRNMFRNSERFQIKCQCNLHLDDKNTMTCETFDISEGGVSIITSFPEYINPEEDIKISLADSKYSCEFYGNIVQVDMKDDKWKYSFKINKIDPEDYKDLLHIIYDRVPPTTHEIVEDSIYEDLFLNINKRKKKNIPFSRKLPRIPLSLEIKAFDDHKNAYNFTLLNFNYQYMMLKSSDIGEFENLSIPIENNFIKLQAHDTLANQVDARSCSQNGYEKHTKLFKITNYQELINSDSFQDLVASWMNLSKENLKNEAKKSADINTKNQDEDFDEMSLI